MAFVRVFSVLVGLGVVSALPELKSISIENAAGKSDVMKYGEEVKVKFTVKNYDGSETTSLQNQNQVVLHLTAWEALTETRVVLPCKLYQGATTPCACNGTETTFTGSFPLCVVPDTNYTVRLSLPSLDSLLVAPIDTSQFEVQTSNLPCKPGYVNPGSGPEAGKEPGCLPCEQGKYSEQFPTEPCTACPEGKTTRDRAANSKSLCAVDAVDASKDFALFVSTFFMLSNAGGTSLEVHQEKTPTECVQLCEQDALCKAFDSGNIPEVNTNGAYYQRGDCFLSYDTERSIKKRDVRGVNQLNLYRKVDAVEIIDVYFRRIVDGSLKASDQGGIFHNEHSPEACAGLCLADPSCKSFDAGRQFPLKWGSGLNDKEWQKHVDNCFLSYDTKDNLPADMWVAPNCTKEQSGVSKDLAPLDVDCDNDQTNGVDYYERIVPIFLSFDVNYDDIIYANYSNGGKVLQPEGKTYTPAKYAGESQAPRAGLHDYLVGQFPHVERRENVTADVVKAVYKALSGVTSGVTALIEPGKDGKLVAHVNVGNQAYEATLRDNLDRVEMVFVNKLGDSLKRKAKLIQEKDMVCPTGTASQTGYGQGDTCKPCALDFYSTVSRTTCKPCPLGTITQVGSREAFGRISDVCVPLADQTASRQGSFRVGFEWIGPYAAELGADGNGTVGQGFIKMTITEAKLETDGSVNIRVFVEARHGEDCNRWRALSGANNQAGIECKGSACSCRDPGLTSYYLRGTAKGANVDLSQLNGFSGITDRNDWLFVARGFTGTVVVEEGNTIIKGKWNLPKNFPGNSAGPTNVGDYDVTDKKQKCVTGNCDNQGFLRLTERCYSNYEAGTFDVEDTFVGSFECYRRGINMAVTGINRRPATYVRKMTVQVTHVDSNTKTVTAQVTVGLGQDGSDEGEAKYQVTGVYNDVNKQITLTPTKDAWLTFNRPKNFPARTIIGTLTQQGEILVGTYQNNKKCSCSGIKDSDGYGATCGRWRNDDNYPWCYVSDECAEAELWENSTSTLLHSPCDEFTGYQEESVGFYETCTSVQLFRVCKSPIAHCEPGWTLISESNRCYKLETNKTYDEAIEVCKNQSSSLASIHSNTENIKLANLASANNVDYAWLGLTLVDGAWGWLDETPVTYANLIRKPLRGPCSLIRTSPEIQEYGRTRGWYTNFFPDNINCNSKIPFFCKKPPVGGNDPCACARVADENHMGGHCETWTPKVKAWSGDWCYVSPACTRGVTDPNTKLTKATCISPDETITTAPPSVTTKFSGSANCPYKQYQDGTSSCKSCTTSCGVGKVSSIAYGDVCGETTYFESLSSAEKANFVSDWGTKNNKEKSDFINSIKGYGRKFFSFVNPNLWTGVASFKEKDFTCCTDYTLKGSQCAQDSKAVSAITSCVDGKDFTCEECGDGYFYPSLKQCLSKDSFDTTYCKCSKCEPSCKTCDTFADKCTSCQQPLFLRDDVNQCVKDCDPGSQRKYWGNSSSYQCIKCKVCDAGEEIKVPCGATTDTVCGLPTTSTTKTTTTLTSSTTTTDTTATTSTATSSTLTTLTVTSSTITISTISSTISTLTATSTTSTTSSTGTETSSTKTSSTTTSRTFTLSCDVGQYRKNVDLTCHDVSDCDKGFEVKSEPAEAADRMCTRCESGFYTQVINSPFCQQQSECGKGTSYRTSGVQAVVDANEGRANRVCLKCPSGMASPGGVAPCIKCDPGYAPISLDSSSCVPDDSVTDLKIEITMLQERTDELIEDKTELRTKMGDFITIKSKLEKLFGPFTDGERHRRMTDISLINLNESPLLWAFKVTTTMPMAFYQPTMADLEVGKSFGFGSLGDEVFFTLYDVKFLSPTIVTTTYTGVTTTKTTVTATTATATATDTDTTVPEIPSSTTEKNTQKTTTEDTSDTTTPAAQDTKSDSGGNNNTIIIIIVIVAVLVLLLVIVVVVIKKKQSQDKGPSNTQAFENPLYDAGGKANPTFDADEGAYAEPQTTSSGYMDVNPGQSSGYMDVDPGQSSGYMDVNPTGEDDDGDDSDEDV